MTVSAITGITLEGQPQELSSFLRSGVAYVLWHSPISVGLKRLSWKPHNALDYTEVVPALGQAFRGVTALYDPTSDHVVVIWDGGDDVSGSHDGTLTLARFNPTTGALIAGPTVLFPGSQPKLSYRSATQDSNWLLYYRTAKNLGVYGRVSEDGGLTWNSGYPLYTGQVGETSQVDVVPYSANNASIAQLGAESRKLIETSMLARTRPLTSIVKHPSVANQFFVGEPSKFDNTTLTDNLRGALVLATDNSKLYHLDGVAQGTADGTGAVALVTVTGTVLAVAASAGPTGNGDDLNTYTLTPAASTPNVDLSGASFAVGLDVSSTHGYVAQYADNSAVLGQLSVVDLTSGTTAAPLSGIAGVRGVAVANFLTPVLIFAATTESGVERLRVYQQNALTPTLLVNTKLTSRANFLSVAPDPTNPTGALLYASLVDRLNVYRYVSAAVPLQLVDSLTLPGGGSFFQSKVATNGNIVVAAGTAGVLVLSPDGKIQAQTVCSGKFAADWTPATVYTLNALVKPRASHQFANSRYYFKCTNVGAGPATSGNAEPSWAATGIIYDPITPPTAGNTNSLQWTPVGLTDGIAVGVALDEVNKRIYAVGSVGGVLGTDGRVWMLSASGLI